MYLIVVNDKSGVFCPSYKYVEFESALIAYMAILEVLRDIKITGTLVALFSLDKGNNTTLLRETRI